MREACKLREPAWLFGLLGLALIFLLGFTLVVFAANGGWNPRAAQALALPSAVAAGLAAGAVAERLRRMATITRLEAIIRGAVGWGAVGFAWPASFLVTQALGGVHSAPPATFLGALAPLVSGAAVGAIAGALAAGAASVLCLTPVAARRSRRPPPG
jgi:hypothetical protein